MKHLILLFIVIALSGCVGAKDSKPVPVIPDDYTVDLGSQWDPNAYLYGEAEEGDYETLEQFRSGDNLTVAAEASIVTGFYYMREGLMEEADGYISTTYSNPFLTPYMQKVGELLYMELALRRENPVAAGMQADQIKASIGDEATDRALTTFCYISGLVPKTATEPYSCVEQRIAATIPTEYLSGVLNILVTSRQDVQSAIFYYASEHNMRHKVRIEKTFVEGDWDFIIDINSGFLSGRGYSISFVPDVSSALMEMDYYAGLNTCGRIIIGVGNGLKPAATDLITRLTDSGNLVIEVDISDSRSANAGMRENLTEWEQESYCAVGAGTEDEINNFVPVLRQYGHNQRIFAVETIDSGKHYNSAYRPYYQEVIVFPAVDLNLSGGVKEAAAAYKDFTGRNLSYEAMLGYDMMQYIYKSTEEGKDYDGPYLTNITGVEGGKVLRPIRAFYIPASGDAEELVLETEGY